MIKKIQSIFGILFILIIALLIRIYGVNWDQNFHLHPDERFLTMVVNGIEWPKNISTYFNTDTSTLNPHNRNYPFFVYGTFPIFFTKFIADVFRLNNYNNVAIVGRILSAITDTGTIGIIFLLTRKIISLKKKGKDNHNYIYLLPFLSSIFYALAVLPIQLSHFFAVDTYVNFFTTLSLYLIVQLLISNKSDNLTIKRNLLLSVLIGVSIGLAVACKINSLIILPILFFVLLINILINKKIIHVVFFSFIILIFFYLSARIFLPYAFAGSSFISFQINPKLIDNFKSLQSMDSPLAMFPPAVQWLNTPSFIFPFKNLVFWGLGLPISIFSICGIFLVIYTFLTKEIKLNKEIKIFSSPNKFYNFILFLFLIFIMLVFVYQGSRYTKNMRYFIFMYPILTIFASLFIENLYNRFSKKFALILCFTILVWPISFLSIYQRQHSRVIASEWIYNNLPAGSTLSYEHWDDPLPLGFPDKNPSIYQFVELPLYDPDVTIKWEKIISGLKKTDYVIMSSNRLWGSIPRAPQRYTIAIKYYKALFDESLGFKKIAEITSYPCFPSTKLCLFPINDTNAEESFTVYDHPKVLIYKKEKLNLKLLDQWYKESKYIKIL